MKRLVYRLRFFSSFPRLVCTEISVAQKRLRTQGTAEKKRKSVQMDSMYPNVPNQWPHNVHDPQHVHVDGAPSSNDDWKDRSASNTSAGGSAAQPLDLSDFGLGDIPGKHFSARRPSLPHPVSNKTMLTFAFNRAVDVHLNFTAAPIILWQSLPKLLHLHRSCPIQCHGIWFYALVKFLSTITALKLFDTKRRNHVVVVTTLNVATTNSITSTCTATTHD